MNICWHIMKQATSRWVISRSALTAEPHVLRHQVPEALSLRAVGVVRVRRVPESGALLHLVDQPVHVHVAASLSANWAKCGILSTQKRQLPSRRRAGVSLGLYLRSRREFSRRMWRRFVCSMFRDHKKVFVFKQASQNCNLHINIGGP